MAQPARCEVPANACTAFADADAVFIGTVTKVKQPPLMIWMREGDYDQTATVTIEKMYKGSKRRTIVFHQLGRDMAPKFIANSRYLFYAKYDRAAKIWKLGQCDRKRLADHATDELKFLDAMSVNQGKTRVYGNIASYDPAVGPVAESIDKMPGVTIKIIGETKEYQVV